MLRKMAKLFLLFSCFPFILVEPAWGSGLDSSLSKANSTKESLLQSIVLSDRYGSLRRGLPRDGTRRGGGSR